MFWRVSIVLSLGLLDILLLGKMLWGPTGIMEYKSLKDQYNNLQSQITKLDNENLAISRDIRLMRTDSKYAEKMVRQKLHYLRDNELVYLFATPGNDRAGATTNDRKN